METSPVRTLKVLRPITAVVTPFPNSNPNPNPNPNPNCWVLVGGDRIKIQGAGYHSPVPPYQGVNTEPGTLTLTHNPNPNLELLTLPFVALVLKMRLK